MAVALKYCGLWLLFTLKNYQEPQRAFHYMSYIFLYLPYSKLKVRKKLKPKKIHTHITLAIRPVALVQTFNL